MPNHDDLTSDMAPITIPFRRKRGVTISGRSISGPLPPISLRFDQDEPGNPTLSKRSISGPLPPRSPPPVPPRKSYQHAPSQIELHFEAGSKQLPQPPVPEVDLVQYASTQRQSSKSEASQQPIPGTAPIRMTKPGDPGHRQKERCPIPCQVSGLNINPFRCHPTTTRSEPEGRRAMELRANKLDKEEQRLDERLLSAQPPRWSVMVHSKSGYNSEDDREISAHEQTSDNRKDTSNVEIEDTDKKPSQRSDGGGSPEGNYKEDIPGEMVGVGAAGAMTLERAQSRLVIIKPSSPKQLEIRGDIPKIRDERKIGKRRVSSPRVRFDVHKPSANNSGKPSREQSAQALFEEFAKDRVLLKNAQEGFENQQEKYEHMSEELAPSGELSSYMKARNELKDVCKLFLQKKREFEEEHKKMSEMRAKLDGLRAIQRGPDALEESSGKGKGKAEEIFGDGYATEDEDFKEGLKELDAVKEWLEGR